MISAGDLEAAVASVSATLRQVTGRDWSAGAGMLEWDCWHTAEHLGDCLLSYAGQLVARPATRYVRFLASVDTDASAGEVLEFAEAGGGILVAVLRAASPQARAYHPTGMLSPAGFAALGCVETLLHGQDIAQGLGLDLDPPRDLCARLLAARFPDAPADLSEIDAWTALQWATGRVAVPGHDRLARW